MQAPTGLILSRSLLYLLVVPGQFLLYFQKTLILAVQQLPGPLAQPVVSVFQCQWQLPAQRRYSLGHDHTVLGQQSSKLIADSYPILAHALAQLVQHLIILLLDLFDRHRANSPMFTGLRNGLSIVVIVFLTSKIALHMLRR